MSSFQSKQKRKKRCLHSEQTTETSSNPVVDLLDEEIEEDDDDVEEIPNTKSYKAHPTKTARPGCRYIVKTSKRRAPYRVDYELYLDDNDHVRAECQHCDTTFAADSVNNGTKNLKKHSRNCEMNPINQSKDDAWKLQKRILKFCPISGLKGEAIGRGAEDCLDAWGLSDKLFTITVDNASSNDVACGYLKSLGPQKGYISGGKCLHITCIAHIINLIVWDGLKEHTKCVDKVRFAVKYVRSSPARLLMFKEQVEKCKIDWKSSLSLDVPTIWNSTYIMFDTALKFRIVFGCMKIPWDAQDPNSVGAPSADDWNKIQRLVVFLKEFYDLTHRISRSLYVTSNSHFFDIGHTYNLLTQWMQSDDDDFRGMAQQMKAKYDKYCGNIEKMNMLIYLAVILDPSLKFLGAQLTLCRIHGQEDGEILATKVKQFAYDLFVEYRNIYAPISPQTEENYDSTTSFPLIGRGSLDLKNSISEQVKMKMRGSVIYL